MERNPKLQLFIDQFTKSAFGWDGDETHCRTCNNDVGTFRDDLSLREFYISGMCQKCQDGTFGGDE